MSLANIEWTVTQASQDLVTILPLISALMSQAPSHIRAPLTLMFPLSSQMSHSNQTFLTSHLISPVVGISLARVPTLRASVHSAPTASATTIHSRTQITSVHTHLALMSALANQIGVDSLTSLLSHSQVAIRPHALELGVSEMLSMKSLLNYITIMKTTTK